MMGRLAADVRRGVKGVAMVPKRLRPEGAGGAGGRPGADAALHVDFASGRGERLLAAVRAVLALTDAAIALALGRASFALLLLLPLAVSALTLLALRRDLPARGLRRVGAAAMGADVAVLVALGTAAGMAAAADAGAAAVGAAALAGGWLTRSFALLEGPVRYGMAGAALTGLPAVAVAVTTTGPTVGQGAAALVAATAMVVIPVVTAGAVVAVLRRSAAHARGTRTRLEQAFAHAPIGLAVLDLQGTVLHANPSLAAMVGSPAEQLAGRSFASMVEPGMRAELVRTLGELGAGVHSGWCQELALRAGDGAVIWSLVGLSLVRDPADGRPQRLVAQVADVSDQRATQQALQHEATHDRLTGLPGRELFVERLSEALAANAEGVGSGVIAVLFCDLDGFKVVNDRYGHARGDQLLAITARRLAGALRLPTLAARWGGDEFVVLCDAQSLQEVRAIARRLVAAVSQPIADEDLNARISMSVGIALPRPGERDPYRVIDSADAAMYRAKRLGTGGWVVSDDGDSLHVPVA